MKKNYYTNVKFTLNGVVIFQSVNDYSMSSEELLQILLSMPKSCTWSGVKQ